MSKIQWVGNWSDEYVEELAKDLRAYGIRARAEPSCYEGHRLLKVASADVARTKALLPEIDVVNGAYIAQECLEG